MNKKQVERWSPFLLLIAIIVIWEVITSGFGVSEFIIDTPVAATRLRATSVSLLAGEAPALAA